MGDLDTTIKGSGQNENVEAQVDQVHRALRVSMRPNEAGMLGSYRKTLRSGVIAAGLTGPLPVWQMRWGSSDRILIPRKLKIQAVVSTTAFPAGAADSSFSLFKTKGHSALDGTNGTYGLFTQAKTGAQSSRFPDSQFALDTTALRPNQGGIVIINTSASGLTGGTKTNDTDPVAQVINRILASAAAETSITPEPAPTLIDPSDSSHLTAMEIDANEGLNLVCDAITGTGTWRLMVEFWWDEYLKKDYFA